jgi:hypothetical protein
MKIDGTILVMIDALDRVSMLFFTSANECHHVSLAMIEAGAKYATCVKGWTTAVGGM